MAKMNEAQREVLSQVRRFVGSNAFVESIEVENTDGSKDVHVTIETERYDEPSYRAALACLGSRPTLPRLTCSKAMTAFGMVT